MTPLQERVGSLTAENYELRLRLREVGEQLAELEAKTDNRKKLQPYQVRQLRYMAADGWTYEELGDYFQINSATAYRVATKKYYKEIR